MSLFSMNDYTPSENTGGGDFQTLPIGDYRVAVARAELKESKSGGTYINLMLDVIEGQYTNRKMFSMITMTNNSEKAVAIGRDHLAQICAATGKEGFNAVDDLLDLDFGVRIKHREYNGKMQENVVAYLAVADIKKPAGNKPASAGSVSNAASDDDCPF